MRPAPAARLRDARPGPADGQNEPADPRAPPRSQNRRRGRRQRRRSVRRGSAEPTRAGRTRQASSSRRGPEPEAARATASAPPAIRYASSAAAEQFADEDWEAEIDPALAGQVYPVLTSDPDIEVPPAPEPGQSQDLEDDAPPFATAPFASVPRLNRVRVTPTPPTDDADDEH